MKIDMNKYNMSHLREADGSGGKMDSIVSRYINETSISLSYQDYKGEKGKVTLKSTHLKEGNKFANQSWIIQIAGLGADPSSPLKDIIEPKIIMPVSASAGIVLSLEASECKDICDSLYKTIKPFTDITRFLSSMGGDINDEDMIRYGEEDDRYKYKLDSSANELEKEATYTYFGNSKYNIPPAKGITTPMGIIENPFSWSEFVYAYLKEWYDKTSYVTPGKQGSQEYASKYPLIVNLALFYATGGETRMGLGSKDTADKYIFSPYSFLLNRLGYFLSSSRKFDTKYGTVTSSKDNNRSDGLESLGYYLAQKDINSKKGKSVSFDDTMKGKDGDNMSNAERLTGVEDSGFAAMENRETVDAAVKQINSPEMINGFWSENTVKFNSLSKDSRQKIPSMGKKKMEFSNQVWNKIDCEKPFHWKDMFDVQDFREVCGQKIAQYLNKNPMSVSNNLFGSENSLFTVEGEEVLRFNPKNIEHLHEASAFSKYERILESMNLLLEAKARGFNPKKDGANLIYLLSSLHLDFDVDGNLISTKSGNMVVAKDAPMKPYMEKVKDMVDVDSSLIALVSSSSAKTVAEALQAYGLVKFYNRFFGTKRESKGDYQLRGYSTIKLTSFHPFFATAIALMKIIEDDFINKKYTISLGGIVEKLDNMDTAPESFGEGEIPQEFAERIYSEMHKIFSDGLFTNKNIEGKFTLGKNKGVNATCIFIRIYLEHIKNGFLSPNGEDTIGRQDVIKMFEKTYPVTQGWIKELDPMAPGYEGGGGGNAETIENKQDASLHKLSADPVVNILLDTIKEFTPAEISDAKMKKIQKGQVQTSPHQFKNFEFCGRIGNRPVTASMSYRQYAKDFPIMLLAKSIAMGNIYMDDSKFDLRSGLLSTGCYPYMVYIRGLANNYISLTSSHYSLTHLGEENSSTDADYESNKFYSNAFASFKYAPEGKKMLPGQARNFFREFLRCMRDIYKYDREGGISRLKPFVNAMDRELQSRGINPSLIPTESSANKISYRDFLLEALWKGTLPQEYEHLFESIYQKAMEESFKIPLR